jgi:hypothetical protein
MGREEGMWDVRCRMWMYEREPSVRHSDARAFDRCVTDRALMMS